MFYVEGFLTLHNGRSRSVAPPDLLVYSKTFVSSMRLGSSNLGPFVAIL